MQQQITHEKTLAPLKAAINGAFNPPTETSHSYIKTFVKHGTIFMIAGGSAWLYLAPTNQFVQTHYPNNQTQKILYQVGTTGGAALVTINTANLFFEFLNFLKDHQELKVIVTLALISSSPYVLLVYNSSRGAESLPLLITQMVATALANTTTHLVPIMLAATNDMVRALALCWYRLPKKAIQACIKSKEEKAADALTKQTAHDHEKLKAIVVASLMQKLDVLENKFFSWGGLNDLAEEKISLATPEQILEALYNEAYSAPNTSRTSHFFNSWLPNIMGSIGAAWVAVSAAGFVKVPTDELIDWTRSTPGGIAIAFLPALTLETLAFYFGHMSFEKVFTGAARLFQGKPVLPVEIKLWPKTSLALLATAGFLCYFSAATAVLFIEIGFADKKFDAIRQPLIDIAKVGIPVYGLVNFFQAIERFLKQVMTPKLGSDDQQFAAKVLHAIETGIQAIQMCNGEDLIKDLAALPAAQLHNLTGMKREQLEASQNHQQNLKAARAAREQGIFGCCFQNAETHQEQQPLLRM